MRAAELCAGYGGLALAVEQVFGAETAWVSEFEDAPSRILAYHWPEVPNHGDMTKIDWSAVEPVDIISGGTPCQDLSAAGRRKGMTEGTRSNLWVQMREAVATIRPTYVIWENVRGAYSAEAASDLEHCPGCMGASTDRGTVLRALGRVLGDLSDLGYDCQWRGLRAADVGAPHGRFRIFVLATLRDGFRCERSRVAWHGRDGSSDDHRSTSYAGHTTRHGEWARQEPWEGGAAPTDPSGIGGERRRGHGDVARTSGGGESEGHQRERHGDAADHRGAADSGVAWGEYEPAIRRWEQALGRRSPAPTEPTGRNGGHRLSARFAEWMMGVPNGWIVDVPGISRNEALKAAGNGVVPQQAIAALRDMLAAQQDLEVAA